VPGIFCLSFVISVLRIRVCVKLRFVTMSLFSPELDRLVFLDNFHHIVEKNRAFVYDEEKFADFHWRILQYVLCEDVKESNSGWKSHFYLQGRGYEIGKELLWHEVHTLFYRRLARAIWDDDCFHTRWDDRPAPSYLAQLPWCFTRVLRVMFPNPKAHAIMTTFHQNFSLKHLRDFGNRVRDKLNAIPLFPASRDYLQLQVNNRFVFDDAALPTRNKYVISLALYVTACYVKATIRNDFVQRSVENITVYHLLKSGLEVGKVNIDGFETAISEREQKTISKELQTVVNAVRHVLLYHDLISPSYHYPADVNHDWATAFSWVLNEFMRSPIRLHIVHFVDAPRGNRQGRTHVTYIRYDPDKPFSHGNLSPKEKSLTVEFWVRTLGVVRRCLVPSISLHNFYEVKREPEMKRLRRYASCGMHYLHFYQHNVSMYAVLCRNYLQALEDHDYPAMRLMMMCILSLVADRATVLDYRESSVCPEAWRDTVQYYGLLHGILARFDEGVYWEAAIFPYRDLQNCDVRVRLCRGEKEDGEESEDYSADEAFGALHSPPPLRSESTFQKDGVIYGFKLSQDNLYTAMTAFIVLMRPHMIRMSAVRSLYELFQKNVRLNLQFPAQMDLIWDLQSMCTEDSEHVIHYPWGSFVRIPEQARNPRYRNLPPVAGLYALLLLDEIPKLQAFRLFCSIRLYIPKDRRGTLRTNMPEKRAGGYRALRALRKCETYQDNSEHNDDVPTFYSDLLYGKEFVPAGMETMERLLFTLEMLSYLPAEKYSFGKASAQLEKHKYLFSKDPPPPLEPHQYRGCMSPWHFARYRYPLPFGECYRQTKSFRLGDIYQHRLLPVILYRDDRAHEDESRPEFETSPFFGSSGGEVQCVYSRPVSKIWREPGESNARGELDDFLRASTDPNGDSNLMLRCSAPV
jgi:hypothetical protein